MCRRHDSYLYAFWICTSRQNVRRQQERTHHQATHPLRRYYRRLLPLRYCDSPCTTLTIPPSPSPPTCLEACGPQYSSEVTPRFESQGLRLHIVRKGGQRSIISTTDTLIASSQWPALVLLLHRRSGLHTYPANGASCLQMQNTLTSDTR